MERTYTDEQLEEMKPENHEFEFEGKEYDGYSSTQMQRRLENTVRKLTREQTAFKAAGLTEGHTAVTAAIRRLKAKYEAFSKAAGLPTQFERMRVLDG